jgi:hypothetical protein
MRIRSSSHRDSARADLETPTGTRQPGLSSTRPEEHDIRLSADLSDLGPRGDLPCTSSGTTRPDFHLHALEFPPEAGGFPRETAGAQSPMTDPVGLASKFVGEMQLAGYVLRAEGEAVSVAPSDEPQFFVLYHSQKLRHLVGHWLAKKGISRRTDEINDVASAILSRLRQR